MLTFDASGSGAAPMTLTTKGPSTSSAVDGQIMGIPESSSVVRNDRRREPDTWWECCAVPLLGGYGWMRRRASS
jgi:hypothetical protein